MVQTRLRWVIGGLLLAAALTQTLRLDLLANHLGGQQAVLGWSLALLTVGFEWAALVALCVPRWRPVGAALTCFVGYALLWRVGSHHFRPSDVLPLFGGVASYGRLVCSLFGLSLFLAGAALVAPPAPLPDRPSYRRRRP